MALNNGIAFSAMLCIDQAKNRLAYRLNRKGTAVVDQLGDANLRRFFAEEWVHRNRTIMPARMTLVETNRIGDSRDFVAVLALGQLQIGSCINGDILCVALAAPHAVSILSHDSFWEDQRADFTSIDSRLEWFLIRLAEKRFVPCDYYQCKDLNEMIAEEARPTRKRRKAGRR
jgi:hypothetical protein